MSEYCMGIMNISSKGQKCFLGSNQFEWAMYLILFAIVFLIYITWLKCYKLKKVE